MLFWFGLFSLVLVFLLVLLGSYFSVLSFTELLLYLVTSAFESCKSNSKFKRISSLQAVLMAVILGGPIAVAQELYIVMLI